MRKKYPHATRSLAQKNHVKYRAVFQRSYNKERQDEKNENH